MSLTARLRVTTRRRDRLARRAAPTLFPFIAARAAAMQAPPPPPVSILESGRGCRHATLRPPRVPMG